MNSNQDRQLTGETKSDGNDGETPRQKEVFFKLSEQINKKNMLIDIPK